MVYALNRLIASAGGLELQMELSCKGSVAGLGLDFTESSGIDIQVGITGRGMVQDVARINAQRRWFHRYSHWAMVINSDCRCNGFHEPKCRSSGDSD